MMDTAVTLTIRPLARGDEPEWRRLWRGYLAFYETELSDAVYDASFARMLGDDPQDHNGLIALWGGQPVGIAHYLFHRHGWKTANVCYLQDLFVDDQVRGRGVGRRLIEAVFDAADMAGAADVYWMTQDNNLTAQRLYDQIGTRTPFVKYTRPLRVPA